MPQSLSMFGELASSSLQWSLGVRKTFRCEYVVISHPIPKILPGMSQRHAATSSAVTFQAHSLMTLHGIEYLRPFFVRRPSDVFPQLAHVPLNSFDHRFTRRGSTGPHDACGCISAPLGAHVCSATNHQSTDFYSLFTDKAN